MERRSLFKPCELWVGGDAFVQAVDVFLDGTATDFCLEIYLINKHNYALKKVEYKVFFYDTGNNLINEEAYFVKEEEIDVKPNSIGLGSRINVSKNFLNARKAEIRLLKGYFSDGNSLDLQYEDMEKYEMDLLSDEEKVILKETAGEDAISIAKEVNTIWRCVCGYFNSDFSEVCSNCSRTKADVFKNYENMETVKEHHNELVKENLEKVENKKIKEISDKALISKEDIEEIKYFLKVIPKIPATFVIIGGIFMVTSLLLFMLLIN